MPAQHPSPNEPLEVPVTQPTVREVFRPWGKFRQYVHNARCTVSLLTVEPGQRLSLQSHERRAELWIVLDDGGEVQIGQLTFHPSAGDELWIPGSAPHRLSCGGSPVRVLEVAFGDWQQEDVTRYEDDYGRK